MENENKALKEKLTSSELENRFLRETMQTNQGKRNFVDVDILHEKGDWLVQKAHENFIFSADEINLLTKDKVLGYLNNNFEEFNNMVEELFKIKWTMQEKDSEAFEDQLIEIPQIIEKVNESRKNIIEVANKRDLSTFTKCRLVSS